MFPPPVCLVHHASLDLIADQILDAILDAKLDPFKGKQPLVEVNLHWKTTNGGRRPSVEDTLRWRTPFGERRPLVEDNLPWKTNLQTKNRLEEQSKEQKGNKRRKYELVVPGWGGSTEIVLNKMKEEETAPLPLTNQVHRSSPESPDIPKLPGLPQVTQPRYPDDNSHITERYEQGLPPVQLHAGHLGEVTLRGGTVTSPLPPTPQDRQGG